MPLAAPLVLTPGEPAGIGPDLLLTLAAEGWDVPVVAVADPELLAARARQLSLRVELEIDPSARSAAPTPAGRLRVLPVPLAVVVEPGAPDAANARALIEALEIAVQGCLERRFAALVTGPLNKAVINQGGIPFTGHTEFIATRCGGALPVMLLVGGGMRVALATTHLPLRAVADALSSTRLERVLRTLDRDLRKRFLLERPRIIVLGLNPHAGEDGHLGDEEQRIIAPTLERLRRDGLRLDGPLAADTAFTTARLAGADAVLAMYHDQGLPVLKHASFGDAVNVTLGLPLIRTSVDHGTAYDIAGTGRADAGSLRAAIATAARLAAADAGDQRPHRSR